MAFREVSVVQIREALRRWLKGDGERPIAHGVGIDRKTARRYITAAVELGVDRGGGEEQLSDELIGQVVERVRPHRPDGHGPAWRTLLAEEARIKEWVNKDLTVVKIGILLARRGVVVPHRTLARFAVERCGAGRRSTTVRVDDPPPGVECQVDFGRLGLVADGERRRLCWALIFTACYSRHLFVWPTFAQTAEEVIAGFEAAWAYFDGVFPGGDPRQHEVNRHRGREHRAPLQRRVPGVRPVTGLRDRRSARGHPDRQTAGGADRALCAQELLRGRDLPRCGRREVAGKDVVHRDRRSAHPRHDPVPAHRGVPGPGVAAAVGHSGRRLRRAQVVRAQGAPGLPPVD